MPGKPKKPCAYPGCPNLTDGRYCSKHQQKVNSNYGGTAEINLRRRDMVVRGRESVISMRRSIPFTGNGARVTHAKSRNRRRGYAELKSPHVSIDKQFVWL